MSDRRRIRCVRSSSIPSRIQRVSKPTAANLKTSSLSRRACACGVYQRDGPASSCDIGAVRSYDACRGALPAAQRVCSQAAGSVPAVWQRTQVEGSDGPALDARTSKPEGTFFGRARVGTPWGTQSPTSPSNLCWWSPSHTQHRLRRRLSRLWLPWLMQYLFKAALQLFPLALQQETSTSGLGKRVVAPSCHHGGPVWRRLRTKTPPAPAQRIPSMGLVRRRLRSKGPPPQPKPQHMVPRGSGGELGPSPPGRGGDPLGGGHPGSGCWVPGVIQ